MGHKSKILNRAKRDLKKKQASEANEAKVEASKAAKREADRAAGIKYEHVKRENVWDKLKEEQTGVKVDVNADPNEAKRSTKRQQKRPTIEQRSHFRGHGNYSGSINVRLLSGVCKRLKREEASVLVKAGNAVYINNTEYQKSLEAKVN